MRGIGKLAAVLVAACALAAPTAAAPASRVSSAEALERGVLAQINQLRARHGLRPLRLSVRLSAAAESHSRAMVTRGFFSHASADGSPFWQRVRRFYGSAGYERWAVGENLIWASPDMSPERALELWLESPPHRKNLLSPRWREVGLAAVRAAAAPGTYGGLDVTVLTANFGVRG